MNIIFTHKNLQIILPKINSDIPKFDLKSFINIMENNLSDEFLTN